MCVNDYRGKGDAPDRFWAAVEPYCADITEADIHLLQEDLKSVSSGRAVPVSGNWVLRKGGGRLRSGTL